MSAQQYSLWRLNLVACGVQEETRKLAIHTKYRTVSIVGGQEITAQGFLLRKGCEIVVATPGRLKDCLDQSYAVLNQCDYVVLDEADRMIEMGFLEQVLTLPPVFSYTAHMCRWAIVNDQR